MYLLTKLIAYDKLGRELTIAYIKEPTALEYRTHDMYSISSLQIGHWVEGNMKCGAICVVTFFASIILK
jgi:hypothetical protein